MQVVKCPQCNKDINPSRYTYCNSCLIPVFKTSSQKHLRSAIYSVTEEDDSEIESREQFSHEGHILEKDSRHVIKKETKATGKLIAATAVFLFAIAFAVYMYMPFFFPEQAENKKLVMAANMLLVQNLLTNYKTQNNKYPASISEVLGKGGLQIAEVLNPYTKKNAEGESWGDYNKFSAAPKPGILLYKFISVYDYEIYCYDDTKKPIDKNGQPIIVKPDTKVLKPQELL